MRRFSAQMGWAADAGGFAIDAAVDERLGFLRKTYGWLTGQILAVAGLTALFVQNERVVEFSARWIVGNFLIYIVAFMGLSTLTRKMLEGDRSLGVQTAAAGLWIVFLSLVAVPLCALALMQGYGHLITQAAVMTTAVFVGLTTYVLVTKQDFSWVRSIVFIGSWSLVAVGGILYFTGGTGGIWYSVLWVGLLSFWTLYDTSRVLHHRRVGQHVAASVDLLLDFVFMFLHILMILMRSRD